tara:strand:- start:13553 stop:14686 length:1134 start_codon:yes stop_codon:yes gene_type:complete
MKATPITIGGTLISAVSSTFGAGLLPDSKLALYATVDASVEYTTNVFLNAEEEEDTIFYVTPGLAFSKNEGAIQINAYGGYEFQRYVDYSNNDAENVKSNISVNFLGNSAINGGVYGGYNETTSASGAIGDVTRTADSDAGGNVAYYVSERTGLEAAGNYLYSDSKTAGYSDREIWWVSGGGFYDYSEALTLNLDVRYRSTTVKDTDDANDSDDIAAIVGATGQLLPTVEGIAEVGIQHRKFDVSGEDDKTAPYFLIGATWNMSDLTDVILTVSQDFNTTSNNLSEDSFSIDLSLEHNFTEDFSGNIGAGYLDASYTAPLASDERDDTQWSAFTGANYQFTDWGSIGLQLFYADRDSNVSEFEYKDFSAMLTASAQF